MNNNYYIVYDYETSGKDARTCQPMSVACVAVDGRRFQIVPGSEFYQEFQTIWDPEECERLGVELCGKGAIQVHGLTEAKLKDAPPLKNGWANFCSHVKQFKGSGNQWSYPIPVGYNNKRYDDIITHRIQFDEPYGFGPKNVFCPRSIDVMDMMFMFTENNPDVSSISADNLIRGKMGYSRGKAHNALSDVIMTADLFCKSMIWLRQYTRKLEIDGAFDKDMKLWASGKLPHPMDEYFKTLEV